MQEKTKKFLEFVRQGFIPGNTTMEEWKNYLSKLPQIYLGDITFRLLFDWHWDLSANKGRAWFKSNHIDREDEIFRKQVELIVFAGKELYQLSYQFRELILLHARVNLRGKSLLEIGGSLPNQLLFEHLGVSSYINIESPDYIDAQKGSTYSERHGEHERRKTIYCNAEEVHQRIAHESIDHIFSVACFEHIYDLPTALEACHACSTRGGTLYSYFAPIYSRIDDGDHGVIPENDKFPKKPIGLHLLSTIDQRKQLIQAGITDPKEIQDFLGKVNFNRIPNRLLYEDYERICTESPYCVLELDRQEAYNLSKVHTEHVKAVRESNPNIKNMIALGFGVHLMKT